MSEEWTEEHIAEVKTFYEMSQHTDWLRGVTIGLQTIDEIGRLKDELTDARSNRNSEVAQLRQELRIKDVEIVKLREELETVRHSWNWEEGKRAYAEIERLKAELETARNSWNFDEGKRIIAERDELRRENELFRAAASKWEIRAKTAIAAGEKRIEELEVQLKDEKYNSQHWFNRHLEVVKQYHMEADRVDATEAEAQIEVARLRTQLADMHANVKEAAICLWQMRMNSKQAANVLCKLRRWDYELGRKEEPRVNFKYHDIDEP